MAHEIGSFLAKASRPAWDDLLRDYASARFKDVHAYLMLKNPDGDTPYWYLCGRYTAKNGFGGYSDWDYFAVAVVDAKGSVAVITTTPTRSLDTGLAARITTQLNMCTSINPAYAHKEFTDRDYGPEMAHRAHGKLRTANN